MPRGPSNFLYMETKPKAVFILHGMRFIKASDYVVPTVKPRRPYNWSDLWRDLYHDYLRSWEWREKRRIVLARCNGICQCGAPVQDVHHLSYDHVFQEELVDFSELVGFCRRCHQRAHGIDVDHLPPFGS